MQEQMSIFDFIKPEMASINELTEEEMVQKIRESTGLDFQFKDNLFGWVTKVGDVMYSVKYSYYSCRDMKGKKFISCGWDTRTEGCGSPIDTLEDAIEFFKSAMRRRGK